VHALKGLPSLKRVIKGPFGFCNVVRVEDRLPITRSLIFKSTSLLIFKSYPEIVEKALVDMGGFAVGAR